MTPLFVAILSLCSALVVAVLSHLLSTQRKQRDELAELRLKAYTDFINAASRLVSARRLGKTDDALDDLALLNDAKTRICICAEPQIVHALAKFWEEGGTLEKENEILAFTRFCMQVRASLAGKPNDLGSFDMSNTLFRLQPSRYSFKSSPRPSPTLDQLAHEARNLEGDA
ncbi:MAG: hypothetical protein V4454_06640 [Pseudomonadota bacterium]